MERKMRYIETEVVREEISLDQVHWDRVGQGRDLPWSGTSRHRWCGRRSLLIRSGRSRQSWSGRRSPLIRSGTSRQSWSGRRSLLIRSGTSRQRWSGRRSPLIRSGRSRSSIVVSQRVVAQTIVTSPTETQRVVSSWSGHIPANRPHTHTHICVVLAQNAKSLQKMALFWPKTSK